FEYPAVSVAFALRGELAWSTAVVYIVVQVLGGLVGVWVAHLMFELPVWQFSITERTGPGQWLAEAVATFGLVLTVLGCASQRLDSVPSAVGLYITAAYSFHFVRYPRRHHCAVAFRHLCGDSCRRGGCLHRFPAGGNARSGHPQSLALA